ncbi:DUF3054 domain-containing protein [Pseudonocardia spinosispora]|uniref:DUF3054 domain-containing protein n=1 Tax=Pseudonocardia spinosispora TaxID=103441 RepID=UPI000412B965|nr:DUF3054 domain-containing protein [Pseudonocardia spinosispora]
MTSQTVRPVAGAVATAAVVDLIVVLVFAAIGRNSHAEGITVLGTLTTAGPFLVALLLGWLVGRVWRAPLTLPTGAFVWAVTAGIGLAVRTVFTHRLPLSFVLVASISLAVLLIGWRLLALLATRWTRSA